MSDQNIKQETWIPHEGMGEALAEWAEEIGLEDLPEEAKNVLIGTFKDGWSMCLHHTMAPARDLSMMLLQMIELAKKHGSDEAKVVLGGQALEFVGTLANQIVGQPADWQLDDFVEAVQVDMENPPEDLPDEVRQAMMKAKEKIKSGD